MALPTQAQWSTNWNKLSNYNALGELLANQAHIFRAFMPTTHDKATIKVNWTDGGGAGMVGVGAGTAQSASAAPAQVNDTFTKEMSSFGSQAIIGFDSNLQTVGWEERHSQTAAIRAIYTKWVYNLIGSGIGTAHAMWGFETFITNAATAGSTMSETNTTTTDVLNSIDRAVTALPSTGDNICLCDSDGYNNIKKQIRALGGVASNEVKTEAFGSEFLTFSGVTFFYTETMDDLGTSATIDAQFDFFNLGDEGCELVVPGEPFIIQGPKQTKGEFDEVFDIALNSQMLYTSPRAAYKLIQRL